MKFNCFKFVYGLFVIVVIYSLMVYVEVDYDGKYVWNIDIIYQVGENNFVVG